MSFYIISEDELKLLKDVNSNTLSRTEGETIIEYRDLFVKFIKKVQLDAQLSISRGGQDGKEQEIKDGIKGLGRIITAIDAVEQSFIDYDKKMKQLEKKAE